MTAHSEKRYQILGAARRYIETHKKSPTLKVLGGMCGVKSSASVSHYLKQLEREGLIERGERYECNSFKLCGSSNFMRLPTQAKKAKQKKVIVRSSGKVKKMTREQRAKHEAKCLERAVELGKRRNLEDPLHDKRSLFSSSERLTATKVG